MSKVLLLTFVMSAVFLFTAADGKRSSLDNYRRPPVDRILFNYKRGGNFGRSRWSPEDPGDYINSLRQRGVLYHRQDREVLPLVRLKKSLRHRRDDADDELLKILRL